MLKNKKFCGGCLFVNFELCYGVKKIFFYECYNGGFVCDECGGCVDVGDCCFVFVVGGYDC